MQMLFRNCPQGQRRVHTTAFTRSLHLQAPTVKNFVLKHGSMSGFFESYDADIICFQVKTPRCSLLVLAR